jgi:hypothetical protein
MKCTIWVGKIYYRVGNMSTPQEFAIYSYFLGKSTKIKVSRKDAKEQRRKEID